MGIRYIGAKTQILEPLLEEISRVVDPGAHVTDLMCGTATVSAALREAGYAVTANDVMTYSYHHARVALLFNAEPTFDRADDFIGEFGSAAHGKLFAPPPYERMLNALGNVRSEEGYFWREFSTGGRPQNHDAPRNYFSPENAAKIDGIRGWIRQLHQQGLINGLEHSLLIHDLIMAANDVANIAGTYGHHLSDLMGRARDPLQLRPSQLLIRADHGMHEVLQGYAEEVARRLTCDLCYIDPPYMKRQYAANYHILETIAREDFPEAVGASGLRPWRDQYSDFCTKTRIHDAFRRILGSMDCPRFLISYSEDGLLRLDELRKLLCDYGCVTVKSVINKRFRSNDSDLPPELREFFIHLEVTR